LAVYFELFFLVKKSVCSKRFVKLIRQIVLEKGGLPLVSVELRPNESQQQLLKRFRKKVMRSGVLGAVRRKRWFVSKSEIRRIKKKKAIRRQRRKSRSRR
jgi:small subunit ribosomal protein S21